MSLGLFGGLCAWMDNFKIVAFINEIKKKIYILRLAISDNFKKL